MRKIITVAAPFFVFCISLLHLEHLKSQDVILASQIYNDVNHDTIYTLDAETFEITCRQPIFIPGGPTIEGISGIAIHPFTRDLFGVVKLNGLPGLERMLVLINLESGEATIIGNLETGMTSITFDQSGILYGISGDSSTPPSTIYTINIETAEKTVHTTLPDDGSSKGENIEYNPVDGLLYRFSGDQLMNGPNEHMQTITIPGSPGTVTPVALSGDDYQGVVGLGYAGNGIFLIFDSLDDWYTVTTTGVVTDLNMSEDVKSYKSFLFVSDFDGDGCGDLEPDPIPTFTQWGIAMLGIVLIIVGIVSLRTREQWKVSFRVNT